MIVHAAGDVNLRHLVRSKAKACTLSHVLGTLWARDYRIEFRAQARRVLPFLLLPCSRPVLLHLISTLMGIRLNGNGYTRMTWQITEPIRCTLPRPLPCSCGHARIIQDLEYERLPTQFFFFFLSSFFFFSFSFSFSFLIFSSVWMVYGSVCLHD